MNLEIIITVIAVWTVTTTLLGWILIRAGKTKN